MNRNKKAGMSAKANKPAIKQKSRQQLYQENTIAAKKEKQVIESKSGAELHGEIYSPRTVSRTKYLKICWNCGQPYESYKINSYACSRSCSSSINYKLKNGYNPAIRMDHLTKLKNVNRIKEHYDY